MSDHDQRDQQADRLLERLFGDLLGAVTTYGVFIGDRLGLYRALAGGEALSPAELATRAGIHERYAREWLEQQAADGILDVAEASPDPARRRFALSPAHAEVLTGMESPRYFTPFARLVTAGGLQLPALLEAYRTGRGVPWAAFGDDMRESQADANRWLFLNQLGPDYLAKIDDVHSRLSAGPASVADLGTGFGWSAIGIAQSYPQVTVDGFDPDAPSIEAARRNAEALGLADRVRFHVSDGSEATEGAYDAVFAFECLHDVPRPVDMLRTMRRLAGSHGRVLVMDERAEEEFAPQASDVERLLYGYSLLVCLPDSMSHQPSAATGTVFRPSTLRGYALEAGFRDVEALPLEHEFFRFYRLHQ